MRRDLFASVACSLQLAACFQVTDLSGGNILILTGFLSCSLWEILTLVDALAFACCFSFLPVASLTSAACCDAQGRSKLLAAHLDKKCSHWIAREASHGILVLSVIACQEVSLFLTAFSNWVLTIKFSFGLLTCLATVMVKLSLRIFGIQSSHIHITSSVLHRSLHPISTFCLQH